MARKPSLRTKEPSRAAEEPQEDEPEKKVSEEESPVSDAGGESEAFAVAREAERPEEESFVAEPEPEEPEDFVGEFRNSAKGSRRVRVEDAKTGREEAYRIQSRATLRLANKEPVGGMLPQGVSYRKMEGQ